MSLKGAMTFTTLRGDICAYELRSAREGHARRVRILTITQIDKLYHRREPQLSWRQWQAGRNLQSLYGRCAYPALRAIDLEKTIQGRPQLADGAMVARAEYTRFMEDIGQLGESALYWIVISEYAPRDYADAKGLYKTDGIGVLRAALDLLADAMDLPKQKDAA